jgi:hypothetical protein
VASDEDRALAIEEIRRILLTYPEKSDSGDLAGVGQFMDGVRFGRSDVPVEELPVRRADEAARQYGETVIYYPDGLSRARHLITNIDIDIDDDCRSASSRSTYVVLQATEGLPLQVICTGGYGDTFEQEDGAWKLKVRTEWMNLKGDLAFHVRNPGRINAPG